MIFFFFSFKQLLLLTKQLESRCMNSIDLVLEFNSLDWIRLHQLTVNYDLYFNMIVTQIYRMDTEVLEYSAQATIVIL